MARGSPLAHDGSRPAGDRSPCSAECAARTLRILRVRRAAVIVSFVLALPIGVRLVALWHAHPAGALYDGDRDAQDALARGVDRWVDTELERGDFSTGDARYDGEWLFATRMMAALGYAQLAIEHPETREENAARIDRCLAAITDPRARVFDREAWGSDAIDDLGSERPHVAYLGYLALALSLARLVDPDTRFAPLEQRIVDHLAARFGASELDLLETYPGEIYPIDNTSFFGALAVHDRATGQDHGALLERLLEGLGRYRDPHTGLLYQSVHPADGAPVDGARGSGTALAAYFLSFADRALSRSLGESIDEQLANDLLGFGTVREYPLGEGGFGDVDSGPVIFGQGVSVTGFSIALARIHGDRDAFEARYATASFFGGPIDSGGTHYALGGPIGDALLFALTTALPADVWAADRSAR